MSILTRLASGRRALPGAGAGIGNTIKQPTFPSGSGKVPATISTRYVTPGQPMRSEWDATSAIDMGFLGHAWVMRCIQTKADTIAGLPFVCGPDPANPSVTNPESPLSRLLGPATPGAPGGPNKTQTARALWAWSKVQYDVTGRFVWNTIRDPNGQIVMLYPLVAPAVDPVPSDPGSQEWWSGFVYHTPQGDRPLSLEQVFYAWRMSPKDPRQPLSILQAASLPISIAIAGDRYLYNLLKNGLSASKMVVAPGIEDEDDERAWEEQFNAEFSGFDNAGKSIFAYTENDYDTAGKLVDAAKVQVIDLATSPKDTQLLDVVAQAKIDITIATGVPESLIGNASQRTYANADSEYRNFWTVTLLADITDLQDLANVNLAPQFGTEVGWFDLSNVVALQPPTIFQPPSVKDAIDEGVVTPQQAANLLSIPNAAASGEDVETAPLGEESSSIGASSTTRSLRLYGQGSQAMDLPDGWGFRHLPVNTRTYAAGTAGWGIVRVPRPKIRLSEGRRSRPAETPKLASDVLASVTEIRTRREGQRALEDELSDLDRLGDFLSEVLPA